MKKILFAFCVLFVSIFAITSCDPATSTYEGYTQGLYTVDRNFVRPEMIDTFYKVDNLADFGLKSGDRAYITMAYEVDNYFGPSSAKYRIKSVEGKLPVHGLTAASEIDSEKYSSPVSKLQQVLINTEVASAMWLWKKYQNINVGYYSNGTEGDFKLSPVGLSGDTLCFALNAKIESGKIFMTSLLSYDISSVVNMLPAEDAKKLAALDSIYTKIATRWHDATNDTIKMMYPFGGKYKNNLKN